MVVWWVEKEEGEMPAAVGYNMASGQSQVLPGQLPCPSCLEGFAEFLPTKRDENKTCMRACAYFSIPLKYVYP